MENLNRLRCIGEGIVRIVEGPRTLETKKTGRKKAFNTKLAEKISCLDTIGAPLLAISTGKKKKDDLGNWIWKSFHFNEIS
ncbi:hypothetical protein KJ761_00315 [Patescibacteria group bacterium]|nr:hypothetical protein [Patescibacteria group bacterium]